MYPQIENQDDYEKFKEAYQKGTEGMEALSSGGCEGCCGEECESHFSWFPCHVCGRPLGGDRVPAHYFLDDELKHIDICLDCECYTEYGRLDDTTMIDNNLE